jgi:hypothetical protein
MKIKYLQKSQKKSGGRENKNRRHFVFSFNNNTSTTSGKQINNSRPKLSIEIEFM